MKVCAHIFPYLLLVSFNTSSINNFGEDDIFRLEGSPYQGVAVRLAGVNNSKSLDMAAFREDVVRLKGLHGQHVWPWIFYNRIIGYEGENFKKDKYEAKRKFMPIKGIDLYNENGALKAFFEDWEVALKIAKELKSPGIIIDPETYNSQNASRVPHVAEKHGRTEEETKTRLKEIGRHLAEITNSIYPDAVLWFLFTGIGEDPLSKTAKRSAGLLGIKYVVIGFLEEGEARESTFKVVTGGSYMLGYCAESLDDLKGEIAERRSAYERPLENYRTLKLGGTIAPWNDARVRKRYFARGECGKAAMQSIGDFFPLMKELGIAYEYLWVYAAKSLEYNPYSEKLSMPYHIMINAALKESRLERSKSR